MKDIISVLLIRKFLSLLHSTHSSAPKQGEDIEGHT